jgi:hypothetical protein
MIEVAFMVWWTFAIIIWSTFFHEWSCSDSKGTLLSISIAVFWPVVAIVVFPAVLYQGCVASGERIRVDLHNRGVLREFEVWLKDRKKDQT